jgi:GTPase SAR1 family protein
MPEEESLKKIKDFFKSNVVLNELEEFLQTKVDSLIGIDNTSAQNLGETNIHTIQDLANLSPDSPPSVKNILPQLVIKWIKIANVIDKVVKEQLKAQKKILMIGLDNGGKSSILAVVQDKFSIIKDLLPTRGVKREKLDFFGYPILSWDLGGQVVYRENMYFKKPGLFFSEADLIIYVIDSQDPDRFTESANYFEQILKIMEEIEEHPPFLVVLNKSDQDVRKTLQWQKNVASIKNKFDNIIKDYTKKGFSIDYYDTTIFQKETIMQMFSIALKRISETSEIIEHILEDFNAQIESRALSLISMDGLIFGSYTKNETDEMLINNTALLLQTLSNFHSSIGLIREPSITFNFPANGLSIRGEKLFVYSELEIPVFLWILNDKTEKRIDDKVDYFKEQIMPLINLFI